VLMSAVGGSESHCINMTASVATYDCLSSDVVCWKCTATENKQCDIDSRK